MIEPLEFLSVTEDFEFFTIDRSAYNHCSERGERLLDEHFQQWIGPRYSTPPKPTFKELNAEYKHRLARLKSFHELEAPEIIIQNEERVIAELDGRLRRQDYGRTGDAAYMEYRRQYEEKTNQWHDSAEKQELLQGIYAYNLTAYNEAKARAASS
jgi:hypothetical protein